MRKIASAFLFGLVKSLLVQNPSVYEVFTNLRKKLTFFVHFLNGSGPAN